LERGEPVDPLAVRDYLEKRGDLEAVGGMDYLAEVLDVVSTAANIEFYARMVRDKAVYRRVIEAGTALVQAAYEGRDDVTTLLDRAEQLLLVPDRGRHQAGAQRLKDLMWPAMERIEARHRGDESVRGIPSGFTDLDDKVSGFQKSDLIILAARPSMGKTAFCLNIAANVAIDRETPVGLFSLEMSHDQLTERLLASESFVDLQRIRRGMLRDEDYPKLAKASGMLGQAPIVIDDTPSRTMLDLRAAARRMLSEHGIRLLIVDYLQLLRGSGKTESRQEEISGISRSLKALARELQIPVIVLSQLSRAVEQRGGSKRPLLSDLRDSGAIEQDADLVLFIYRQEMYDPTPETEGTAEILIAKHRNGPTGTVRLAFLKQHTRFENYSDRDPHLAF
jgi:replicative DNA helicase